MNETLRRWHRVRLHIQCNGWTFGAHVPNSEMQCDDVHVPGHEKFIIYRCRICFASDAASAATAAVAVIDAAVLHNATVGCNQCAECIVVRH